MSAMTDTLKSKISAVSKPISAIGDVSLKSLEKLASMQISSAKYYASLNIGQLREALGTNDIKAAKNFAAGRISYLSKINKRLTEDYKGIVALRDESKSELAAAFSTAEKAAPPEEKTPAKPAAKKATAAAAPKTAAPKPAAKKTAKKASTASSSAKKPVKAAAKPATVFSEAPAATSDSK